MRLQFFISTVFALSVTTGFCASAEFVGSSAPLPVEHTIQVPGDTLKAGGYSISIVEQIADRMIVRIDSTSSTNHAIFLGVPSSAAKIGGDAGLVTWPNGLNKTPTVRGFVFPNGNAVEFVYPKADAAALAKANSAAVVAVDPRSEGRASLKSLSHDELEIVNLWLLSLTTTGPDNKTPAVLAQRYDAVQNLQNPTVSSVAPVYTTGAPQAQTAPSSVSRTSAPIATKQTSIATTAMIAPVASQPQPVPQAKRVHVVRPTTAPEVAKLEQPEAPNVAIERARRGLAMSQLPHTAGHLAGVWMLGALSLFGYGLVRFGRSSLRRMES